MMKLIKNNNSLDLSNVKENFNYLFVGHWMQGKIGHDRKNVGLLVIIVLMVLIRYSYLV